LFAGHTAVFVERILGVLVLGSNISTTPLTIRMFAPSVRNTSTAPITWDMYV